jgi:mono/diheme cytochrome c family protein
LLKIETPIMGKTTIRWASGAGAAILALAWLFGHSANAASARRGMAFARTNCAQCHSIDRMSASPQKEAPPFRMLGTRYPLENLEEALAEGIVTSHPDMPEFRLEPDQIGDLMAFLRSLQ